MPKVITSPPESPPPPIAFGATVAMSNDVANALTTGRILSEGTLLSAKAHYADLAERLLVSGPAFSASRVIAVQMHNRCIARLREGAVERARRQREAQEFDAGLVEIEA